MPHKDRDARLAYLRAWKKKNRPPPQSQPQADASLPPHGIVIFSADKTKVQCHACGRWFRSLNTHLKIHDFDARSYKAFYELPRTISLLPPATAERYREVALKRDQGRAWKSALPPAKGRPSGQDVRLGVRISASTQRQGIYTRGGNKTKS